MAHYPGQVRQEEPPPEHWNESFNWLGMNALIWGLLSLLSGCLKYTAFPKLTEQAFHPEEICEVGRRLCWYKLKQNS